MWLVDTRGVLRIIEIGGADDQRLADYTRLTDGGLRTHLEAEHGLFIAEGTKVITRAVAAGYPVRSMLLASSRIADLPALGLAGEASAREIPVYVVSGEVAERLTGYRVHRGALASLGVDAVVLSPRCADPLYRRSVKVSMGAVFAIPYARMSGWFDGLDDLKSAGFRVLALTPDERATPVGTALRARGAGNAGDQVALVFGTEGNGLSARWLHEADEKVSIPMDPAARAAGVDSLNVVAAAAIACHLLVTG